MRISNDDDQTIDHLADLIIRYRMRLPIPRYWLRRTVAISAFLLVMIGGATGIIPSLSQIFSRVPVRVMAFIEGKPDRVLMQMVAEGQIRPARQTDIDQWILAAKLSDEERDNLSLYPDHAFVVLEDISLPGDMHGAHSRDFIIPAGVSPPAGEMAHNGYYFLENGTCLGGSSVCGH